jgi:hypothetical protein
LTLETLNYLLDEYVLALIFLNLSRGVIT